MLCVVKEDTEEVVARRRMQTLRDLGARRASNLTEAETIATACRELAAVPVDLPFSLVYLYDDDGRTARLAGSTGFTGEHPAAPPTHRRRPTPAAGWPATWRWPAATVVVDDLEGRFFDLPTGAWPVRPRRHSWSPLPQRRRPARTASRSSGSTATGPLDDDYRDFCDLIAGQLAASITDARAYEFEQRRAETLAELDQAKTDFFTNVSHEFRTPLTLLLGPAEDALADETNPLSGRQRERIEVILRNGQRLLKLVNTLLDFSRLESGRVEARFEPVDLAQYTRELASMFETAAERLGPEPRGRARRCPSRVYVDRDLWAKVVLNLLSNAMKFTFAGGITVRLRRGRRRGRAERQPTPAPASPSTSCRTCSSGSTGSPARGPAPTRGPGSAWPWCRSSSPCTAARSPLPARRARAAPSPRPCRSAAGTCRPSRSRRRPPGSRPPSRPSPGLPRRGHPLGRRRHRRRARRRGRGRPAREAAGARGRRQRRHPGVRRVPAVR